MLRRVCLTPSCGRLAVTTTTSTASILSNAFRWATFTVDIPKFPESVTQGKVASVEVKVGDEVPEDTIIALIETDKTTLEVRTDKSGVVQSIAISEGDMVKEGNQIAVIDEKEVAKKKKKRSAAPVEDSNNNDSAAPESKSDSKQPAAEEQEEPKKAAPTPAVEPKPVGGSRVSHSKGLSMMRLRIADRLKGSQNTNALLTTFNEIDVTNLVNLRAKYKDAFEKKHGVKFGLMSPFVKASAHALMDVPVINAYWKGDSIEYHDFVDISVAVSAPKGLLVPVMRNVEQMSFADIEKTLQQLSDKAKAGKITPDDMAGGTFTISNGGTFGSWMGTPIVNPPQSAILGMHAIKKKPWVNEKDEIVVRQIMAVALTYDHRLIDGRDAVTFLVKVKNIIEDPTRMLLDLA